MPRKDGAGETGTAPTVTWDALVDAARESRELLHRLTQNPDAVKETGLSETDKTFLDLFEAYVKKSHQTHQQVADGLIVALMN